MSAPTTEEDYDPTMGIQEAVPFPIPTHQLKAAVLTAADDESVDQSPLSRKKQVCCMVCAFGLLALGAWLFSSLRHVDPA